MNSEITPSNQIQSRQDQTGANLEIHTGSNQLFSTLTLCHSSSTNRRVRHAVALKEGPAECYTTESSFRGICRREREFGVGGGD